MADLDGEVPVLKDDSNHLGKRKRSASPEKKALTNGNEPSSLQKALEDALAQAKDSESTLSFLRQPIPLTKDEKPDAKRVRLTDAEDEAESGEPSIEQRILSGHYKSQEQVLKDIASLRPDNASEHHLTNGDSHTSSHEDADAFLKLFGLQETSGGMQADIEAEDDTDVGQIIMLRSMTEKGVATLYSGMQPVPPESTAAAIDGRKLPNGFDLAQPIKLEQSFLAPPKQPRKFADVFGPHRNTKALEMPRSRTAIRSNTLTFNKEAFPERPISFNRHDYKVQQLGTSSWMDYSRGHALSEQDASRKYRDKGVAANDFRAALIANDHSINASDSNLALFKQAFSSFAPVTDSSSSLINDEDRNRMWWHKQGAKRLKKIFTNSYPDLEEQTTPQRTKAVDGDDEFRDLLDYDPTEENLRPFPEDQPQTIDDVLEEVSELLETVHSYQRIRGLETRQTADPFKPSNAEFDTYEILRSQLAILVGSVPPYLVSKLDGDKLSDLNISSNITLETVDYRGTMQPDDFTLAKYRAAHQSAAARLPQAVAPIATPRQPYQTQQQTPAAHYNTNLQAYAQNLGIQAQYAQRQAQQYATPQTIQQRPNYAAYQQNQSNTQTAAYTQPNVQQFQRQQAATPANGYSGAWNTTKGAATAAPTPTPAGQSFAQAPSQPGYQQRAQRMQQQHAPLDYAAVAMQHSPTRATASPGLVNGTGYYPQQHQQQYQARPVMQQQYQQQQQAQR